jgi:host factor-I protein
MDYGGTFFVRNKISESKEIGIMESKPAQNIQDTFLNTVRKDKSPITIYLVSGVKLTGKIRSFDKYSVLLENNSQEQLIFKHAISTVVSGRAGAHPEPRPEGKVEVARVPGTPLPPASATAVAHEAVASQGR